METRQRNPNTLAWLLALLIGLGLTGGFYWNKNRIRLSRYNQADMRADSLVSVKFQLESDLRSLAKQLETATDDKSFLTKQVAVTHDQLNQQLRAVQQLRQVKANQANALTQRNQQLTELTTARDSLENQMAAVPDKINWLTDANSLLIRQNEELQQRMKDFDVILQNQVSRSITTGDDFLISAGKANGKETAKAGQINTLTGSVNVAAELNREGSQRVFLSLKDKKGNALSTPLRTVEETVYFSQSLQRVSFRLVPGEPLKPGLYRPSVYTENSYLGSVEDRFRDSL